MKQLKMSFLNKLTILESIGSQVLQIKALHLK